MLDSRGKILALCKFRNVDSSADAKIMDGDFADQPEPTAHHWLVDQLWNIPEFVILPIEKGKQGVWYLHKGVHKSWSKLSPIIPELLKLEDVCAQFLHSLQICFDFFGLCTEQARP